MGPGASGLLLFLVTSRVEEGRDFELVCVTLHRRWMVEWIVCWPGGLGREVQRRMSTKCAMRCHVQVKPLYCIVHSVRFRLWRCTILEKDDLCILWNSNIVYQDGSFGKIVSTLSLQQIWYHKVFLKYFLKVTTIFETIGYLYIQICHPITVKDSNLSYCMSFVIVNGFCMTGVWHTWLW